MTKPWYLPRATGLWRYIENVSLALGLLDATDVRGAKYDDGGYRLEELGPARWKNGTPPMSAQNVGLELMWRIAGHEVVMQNAGAMMGCPVHGEWAREGGKAA